MKGISGPSRRRVATRRRSGRPGTRASAAPLDPPPSSPAAAINRGARRKEHEQARWAQSHKPHPNSTSSKNPIPIAESASTHRDFELHDEVGPRRAGRAHAFAVVVVVWAVGAGSVRRRRGDRIPGWLGRGQGGRRLGRRRGGRRAGRGAAARGRGRRRPDRAVEPVRHGFAPGRGAVGHGGASWRGLGVGTLTRWAK
jgi:hypothetical protein